MRKNNQKPKIEIAFENILNEIHLQVHICHLWSKMFFKIPYLWYI